jgi:hypothetical protein
MPFFAAMAYYDMKGRDIPTVLIALSWFVYALTFALFPFDLGMMLLMLIIPIFGIGFYWLMYLLIEEIYKRKWVGPIIRKFRFGEADVFVLPLMLSIILQFGGGIGVLWGVSTFAFASLWFNDLKRGSYQKKHGIPLLTFAFIGMLFCYLMVILLTPIIDVSGYI